MQFLCIATLTLVPAFLDFPWGISQPKTSPWRHTLSRHRSLDQRWAAMSKNQTLLYLHLKIQPWLSVRSYSTGPFRLRYQCDCYAVPLVTIPSGDLPNLQSYQILSPPARRPRLFHMPACWCLEPSSLRWDTFEGTLPSDSTGFTYKYV